MLARRRTASGRTAPRSAWRRTRGRAARTRILLLITFFLVLRAHGRRGALTRRTLRREDVVGELGEDIDLAGSNQCLDLPFLAARRGCATLVGSLAHVPGEIAGHRLLHKQLEGVRRDAIEEEGVDYRRRDQSQVGVDRGGLLHLVDLLLLQRQEELGIFELVQLQRVDVLTQVSRQGRNSLFSSSTSFCAFWSSSASSIR